MNPLVRSGPYRPYYEMVREVQPEPEDDRSFRIVTRRSFLPESRTCTTAAILTMRGTNSSVYPKWTNQTCRMQDAAVEGTPMAMDPQPIHKEPRSNKFKNSICA